MRKYFVYFMIYSFLGFVLERIINVIFLGYYYDNSVLVGPYQPLYGLGILLAVIFYDLYLKDMKRKLPKYLSLIIIAILTIHPIIDKLVGKMPKMFFKWTFLILTFIFVIDVIYTFFFELL